MYRKLLPEDLDHLKAEISKDSYHKDMKDFDQNFTDKRCKTLVFEDNQGVVMYISFAREIVTTVQFCNVERQRIRNIFETHLEEVADGFRKAGFISVNYWTNNRVLAFFLRRFGFRKQEIQRKSL
jgi:hypothetical protein